MHIVAPKAICKEIATFIQMTEVACTAQNEKFCIWMATTVRWPTRGVQEDSWSVGRAFDSASVYAPVRFFLGSLRGIERMAQMISTENNARSV